ncbi:MAG: metallophosphoesterase [Verrucomicrobiaceae bacterium]|nr:metallophosphoesterase [Verrucomicrobiaceae bacterium]
MANNRRRFLKVCGSSIAGGVFASPALLEAVADEGVKPKASTRIGFIADVHQDIMHDGVVRLKKFIAAMNDRKVDMIVNLGDFCVPHSRNDPFLATWKTFTGPRFHVIGNHDTDEGFTREQVVDRYEMPSRYYSADVAGLHVVVLDANDPDGKTKRYPMFIAADQLEWLRKDLHETTRPTVVCVHQPIDSFDKWVINAGEVRSILRSAKTERGSPKVVAVFSGHAHLDYVTTSDEIPHVQINSASYAWVGIDHANYSEEITNQRPRLRKACPYAEPLWAVATLDFERGELRLEGRESQWVGSDPWELGIDEDKYQRSRELSRPAIRNITTRLG